LDLRLHAVAPGDVSDKVTIFSDDMDDFPFEFTIAAQIGVQIVDNDDPGFKLGWGGSPFAFANDTQYVDNDFRYHAAGRGTNWVDYEFKGLTPGEFYQVSATWVPAPGTASNAQVHVYDGTNIGFTQPPMETVGVDQRSTPDDFQDHNTPWENVTVVQVQSSGALTIRLTDKADGWVYADAFRIEQAYLPKVQVNVDDWQLPSGEVLDLVLQSGEVLDFGTVLDETDTSTAVTIENRGILPLALDDLQLAVGSQVVDDQDGDGMLDLGGIHVDLGNFGGDLLPGDTMTFTVSLDTTPLPDDNDRSYSGEITFSTIDVTVPLFRLPVTGKVTDDWVVDNDDAGFTVLTGDAFELLVRDTQYVGNDVHLAAAGDGSSEVEWKFDNVTPGITYEISATWVGGINNASDAPFTILGGATPIDVAVDQRPAPDGTGGGAIWQLLSPVTATGTEITVRLTDDVDNWVTADAVKLDVPDPGPLRLSQGEVAGSQAAALSDASVAPVLSEAIAQWQSAGLTPPS